MTKMKNQNIIAPVPVRELQKELTPDKFIRPTARGKNEIYIITAHNSPAVMQEVGRLREEAFRAGGGGTGKEADIDELDNHPETPYRQLVIWDPKEQVITGGYRFMLCNKLIGIKNGIHRISSSEIFNLSEPFVKEYFPYMIELGRSFVRNEYQAGRKQRKGIYALDNLWDGLGTLVENNPWAKYFFGKVTIYPEYPLEAKKLIKRFFDVVFPCEGNLATPKPEVKIDYDVSTVREEFRDRKLMKKLKRLNKLVKEEGTIVPPLVNAYSSLSEKMQVFGTARNPHFGNVEETAIMIPIESIIYSKIENYVGKYRKWKKGE